MRKKTATTVKTRDGRPRESIAPERRTTGRHRGDVRRHVRQRSERNCGQCCIAMLLDLDDDEQLPRKMLRHQDMRLLLESAGIDGEPTSFKPSDLCLMFIRYEGGSPRHWAILSAGTVFDPLLTGPRSLVEWDRRPDVRKYGARVTSYIHLEVRRG